MSGSVLLCAMLVAGVDPVPPVAPAPRLVKPDVSLVVIEWPRDDDEGHARVLRVGFCNGKPLPPEVVWKGAPSDVLFMKVVNTSNQPDELLKAHTKTASSTVFKPLFTAILPIKRTTGRAGEASWGAGG